LNIADLARNCGIAVPTAKSWLSLLETSYILFLLPSYHDNMGKRITKSPKLYFYDVGLATHLIGIDRDVIIENRTLYGALFENMVVTDIIKNFYAHNIPRNLTFFRDSNQHEIDLIIEQRGRTLPIEIKASETIQPGFFKTLSWFQHQTQSIEKPLVIYGGNQNQLRSESTILSWRNIDEMLSLEHLV
jgi:predicted AAA+ superfamily ATPase